MFIHALFRLMKLSYFNRYRSLNYFIFCIFIQNIMLQFVSVNLNLPWRTSSSVSLRGSLKQETQPNWIRSTQSSTSLREGLEKSMMNTRSGRLKHHPGNHTDQKQQIIRHEDIFKPLPGRDDPIRTVITKGVAGIGKTFLTQNSLWTGLKTRPTKTYSSHSHSLSESWRAADKPHQGEPSSLCPPLDNHTTRSQSDPS